MSERYCGNNSLHPDLVYGRKKLGTLYECLQIGIGVGLNSPIDDSYALPYSPIDKTNIYCGKKRGLPDGYTRRGSSPDCLRKGVGIGKRMKALKSPKNKKNRKGSKSPKKRKGSKNKRKNSKSPKKRKGSKNKKSKN